ncbi:MAG TPA: hypothetical protein VG168_07910 [Bryobacteraceae bacterium]|nr:hypothetical protein [Bryobacteraceae bacterium]
MASSPATKRQIEGEIWNCLDLWQPEPVSLDFNRRLEVKIQASERKRRARLWQLSTVGSALAVAGFAFWSDRYSPMPEKPVEHVVLQSNTNPIDAQAMALSLADLNMLNHIDFIRP